MYIMKYSRIFIVFILISMVPVSFQLAAADDRGLRSESFISEINACALKTQDDERLACFDAVTKSFSAKNNVENPKPYSLPETLGGRKFDDSKEIDQGSRGLVKSCKKSYDGRWFFIFDNGQVWKQVDRSKRRFKECNFRVTIKKDSFGYKMFMNDGATKIRIKRHK